MKRHTRLASGLLLVLVLNYFAAITLFPHQHLLGSKIITHSHPYSSKQHSHSSLEYLFIHFFKLTAVALIASTVFVFHHSTQPLQRIIVSVTRWNLCRINMIQRRGPPSF
ncbi:MAG: hypothetical protein PHR53_06465 [Bacteroidales bacterium]|nr:hypothetical protein [Bacteroidales bacterium]